MRNEISLAKFLSRFMFLEGEDLKKITHEEVERLFPTLICSFDKLEQYSKVLDSLGENSEFKKENFDNYILTEFDNEKIYSIQKKSNNSWILIGDKLKKLLEISKINSDKSVGNLAKILKNIGVCEELKKLDAKDNDIIKVFDQELCYKKIKDAKLDARSNTKKQMFILKELIYSGRVMFVNDGKRSLPYFVPVIEMKDLNYSRVIRKEEEGIVVDDKVYDYTTMSVYELRCLLQRKFNSYRNQSCARRELNRRGVILRKKYNRNEFKRKDYDD